ncbi:PspC family transcriptional regulator [Pedobacter ginsengisoli]|uniref:PspC family transcriptional regulator n=1 Tax=Pedobacter ginsengisoli TaxID=363852 RepID=A0A2D1UAV4_9SPHI|nr:PspC domain-containing protein [Pedobacter ginsengisoli]ATP58737.1 PspC family transcriptional regulator [Pedobacter ginsengisoli]
MKKTLNINIGNSIIHIEEDAYEILTVYLNEVKQHFARNADDFEIVTDIENRIAEMFVEILANEQRQVVNFQDVQTVIAQMGSVKDFESSEEEPEEYVAPPHFSVKKLYRDTDQAMIAGVCSGLSHYLDIESRLVRLIAIATIFLGGSGILAYVVLWIMIPRAVTKAEKMTMRGEEANLKGFANSYLQPLAQQSRGFIAEFLDVLGNFINGTGKVIFKIIAAGIIAFGSLCILSLIVALAALLGLWDSNIYQMFPLNIVNQDYLTASIVAVFLVFAIPVLALVLFSIRVAFNSRPANKSLSFGLLIIWLAGVAVASFYVVKIGSEFKEGAEFTQVNDIKPYQVYTLNIDRTRFFTKEDSLRYSIDPGNYNGRRILTDLDHKFDAPRNIRLNIEKSENGKSYLSQYYKARGKTFEMALKNAQNIHYDFLQHDSLLTFSPMLQFIKAGNWRGQEVELTLKVPVGTRLNISKNFSRYLDGYGYWDCDHDSSSEFTVWKMTQEGIKCEHEEKENNGE